MFINKHLRVRKTSESSTYLVRCFKGTVVNQLQSLYGGSLTITLIVPIEGLLDVT